MNLSKSRYTAYCQCPKNLWYRVYHPEFAAEVDPVEQARLCVNLVSLNSDYVRRGDLDLQQLFVVLPNKKLMNYMWNKKTNTEKIGNYVYELAIPVFGSTYTVKYVGQASSSNPGRCFQHADEAKKYLKSQTASNVKKVEMINY